MKGSADMLQRIVEVLNLEPIACAEERKSDLDLQDSIEMELRRTQGVDASKIGVFVENGVVTLAGRARNFSEKCTVGRVVRQLHGVEALLDHIEVRQPGILWCDDEMLAKAAGDALECSVSVPIRGVKILVEKGWVTLEGETETWYEGWVAEHTVSQIHGVRGVQNNLTARTGD